MLHDWSVLLMLVAVNDCVYVVLCVCFFVGSVLNAVWWMCAFVDVVIERWEQG